MTTKPNHPILISVLMLISRWQIPVLLLAQLAPPSAQRFNYVTPIPSTPCPGEPCHTLSEYIADQYFNNLPVNTTMEFLPGNHTLERTISVTNLRWLTLHGDSSTLPEVTSRIVCTWPAGFVFADISELYISALAFISCGRLNLAAIQITSAKKSSISNCNFYNNTNKPIIEFGSAGKGILYVKSSTVNLIGNTFQNNYAYNGGAVAADSGTVLSVTYNKFLNNSAGYGGALHIAFSSLNLINTVFQNNSAQMWGGALNIDSSNVKFSGNKFQNNNANSGGALAIYTQAGLDTLNLTTNEFRNNSAKRGGGAIIVQFSILNLIGNTFQTNSAESGGAIEALFGTLNLTGNNTFQNNSANNGGGVFHLLDSLLMLTGSAFQNNSADVGGTLYAAENSTLTLIGNIFQSGSADTGGGALEVEDSRLHLIGNTFCNNFAVYGGALQVVSSSLDSTENVFQSNSAIVGGVISASNNSTVKMYGRNVVGNSTARYGGCIAALGSQLEFEGNTIFENNTAGYGGGLYVHDSKISGNMTLISNSATEGEGGAGYASRSTFHFAGKSTIENNSAIDGGGLLLSESKLYLQPYAHVSFISNSASRTGGAIKIEQHNPVTDCSYSLSSSYDVGIEECFFQIQTIDEHLHKCDSVSKVKNVINSLSVMIYFGNNSAVDAGADLHGGSVDSCIPNGIGLRSDSCPKAPTSGDVFDDIIYSEDIPDVSSDALSICTCRDNQTDCNGSYHHPEPVYPGGTIEIVVIALGQRNGPTAAIVINTPNGDITVNSLEKSQKIANSCSALTYTMLSRAVATAQKMNLTAESPCSSTVTVTVDIQLCPPGFQLSETHPNCTCAKRLQQFTDKCLIDDFTVLRASDATFWVGYSNESKGLILHPNCPFDYCTSKETYLAVDDSDKQCNYDRGGLLCGRCSKNLSLVLGSSRCLECSNSYLSLLAAFAFAGFALVVFLLVLRLTVAAGTINGLIIYANVVTVNSAVFFQPRTTNVLTIFIAWLNLDLGFEVCFYNGMDAYVKTWLQFAFPLYVWALVGLIIIGSYYSGRVAKIFGSNPVAVLATLFLLSYAKLLRTVIASFSYTFLDYPNNSQIAVWLYDGNIRYLRGKHIPLFIAAMVCLVFLFLPYTMVLIFSQWLQAKSKWKIFSCVNSRYVKPFLDAYHAPYSNKHRYWTGLMLLLRFVLFLISAVNALGDPRVNLLVIASSIMLTLPTILGTGVYKTWHLGLLETSFLLNLAVLAVATLYVHPSGGNQNAATFTSVSIAFATFTVIALYHSVQQVKGTRLWRRLRLRHDYISIPLTDVSSGPDDDPPDTVIVSASAPTKSVVDIRELQEQCTETD